MRKCQQVILKSLVLNFQGRSLTRPSQLKLANETFPIKVSWVLSQLGLPKFLNPIKLENKYYWFFVHTRGYKLQFEYDHLLITLLH